MAKKMLILEYESNTSEQDLDPPTSKCQRVQQNEKSKSLLWPFCDEIMEVKSDSEVSHESVEYVVDTYLKEPNQPQKSNPLQYWKEHQQWPILASLASKYLLLHLLMWLQKDYLGTLLQKNETVSRSLLKI